MTTFVLVAGAGDGGWAWHDVIAPLRAAGHAVYPVTLTGLGERAHLARPDIDLTTHTQDVLGVLRCEELREVVLVGHSYGGMVITGVADRAPERLASLVYVDALIPENGQSVADLLGQEALDPVLAMVETAGEGWRSPPDPEINASPFQA
jgi:pimeloyl-ACP methyl ester carboxylesterase